MLILQKASAGSGKTFTLTKNYIKFLLGEKNPDTNKFHLSNGKNRHRAILAITFTNKATEEMKARIVKQLSLLADKNGKSDYRDDLCKEFGCTNDALSARAAVALNELLIDFGNFNVSTIDAFFQMVLRTFAHDANISGNYEVELDEDEAVYLGVSEMLSSINADSNGSKATLESWLKQYMLLRLNDGKAFNIFVRNSQITGDLVKYVKKSLNETYKLNSEVINKYLSDSKRITDFTVTLNRKYEKAIEAFYEKTKKIIETLSDADVFDCVKYVKSRITLWGKGVIDVVGKDLPDSLNVAYNGGNVDYTKVLTKPGQAKITSDVADSFVDFIKYACENYELIRTYKLLLNNIFHMGIIGEVERHITDVHRENNAILLGDTGKILQDIIKKDDVPFIYERLGVKLRHYLIDEFQDTSRLQWYDIRPLIDESLAGGNDNLIIGDEKQAIYRFRNSDPSLIVKDVPDTFRRQGELDLHGESIDENRNWRSAREIVQFNNALFVQLSKELNLYSDIYANIVQDVAKKNLPGFVEVKSYNDENESLVRMVENVRRQLDSGYHQKDIAVLCARRDECGMVVNYLMNAAKKPDAGKLSDLKIITEEALIVGNSPAVRQIVGVLRFVDAHVSLSHRRDSKRKVTAAEIVNRYEYFRSQGCEPSEAMAKSFSEEGKVADSAAIEVAKMECTSVPSVVERIIASDFIDKDTCNNDNIYITAFQDMVVDFCSHGSGDLHSFMKWWDENGSQRSLIVPDGVDGVRVMTIHKSKGLEFACVHVPLLKGEFDSPDNMMWVPTVDGNGKLLPVFKGFNPDCVPPMIPLNAGTVGKMEMYSNLYDEAIRDESIDRLNQVYVAFTRASRELIIGYDCSSKIGVTMEKCFDELSQQRCDEIVADANKIGKQISCNLLVSLADKKKDIPVEPKKKPTDGDSIDNDPASGKKKKQKQPETLLLLTVGSSTSPGEEKAKDDDAPDIITMEPYYSFKNESIWDKVTIEDVESVSPRKTGIELHTVMGYIRRSSDIHRAVLKANMRGVISHDKMDEIEAMLNTEFAKPLVKVWFDGYTRLLRERSIAVRRENRVKVADGNNGNENDEVGDTLSHYRPDRVVWTSTGEIHIIDFKFGEELPRKYVRQLTGYMYLLRSLSAGLPSSDVSPNASSNKCAKVRGFIWYPLKSEIYEIINSVPVLQK